RIIALAFGLRKTFRRRKKGNCKKKKNQFFHIVFKNLQGGFLFAIAKENNTLQDVNIRTLRQCLKLRFSEIAFAKTKKIYFTHSKSLFANSKKTLPQCSFFSEKVRYRFTLN